MKNTLFSAALLTFLISLGSGATLFANHASAQQGQWPMMCQCPACRGMMKSGMGGQGMRGRGWHNQDTMMGRGMWGPGMGDQGMMTRPGMGNQGTPDDRMNQTQKLTTDEVRTMLERNLEWQGNPRLQIGNIEEKNESTVTAEIVTADGSLVQRLEVDRQTGWMKQIP